METDAYTDTDWTGVREQVLALRGAPHADEVFGAVWQGSGHGFELAPVLTEDQVADAEAQLGVVLPPAYRSFLTQVGAGGAGPHYGLHPLQRDRLGWHWGADRSDRTHLASLRRPFPGPDRQIELGARMAEAEDPAWDALLAELTAGTVCLNHQGCGAFSLLVVTGGARGTVWTDAGWYDRGILPGTVPDSGPIGFRAWYLDWLDRATRTARDGGHR